MHARSICVFFLLFFALSCGSDDATDDASKTPGGPGGPAGPVTPGGGPSSFDGASFPWKVFDNSVVDVPTAAAPGKTWYCDPVKGNDSWDGTSFTFTAGTTGPRKTLTATLTSSELKAGDTILLGGGIYREIPDFNSATGKSGAPITIGSYGRGTGAPIVDGGSKPNTWTKYTAQGQTTVWQTSTAGLSQITATRPVLGIYVNTGKTEAALSEVLHGQVDKYESDPLPPNQTQADIKDKSSHWYFDPSANILYADFGGTLGSGDPNPADVSILSSTKDNHEPLITLAQGHGFFTFIGLSLRAGSWTGVYAESSGNTFEHCDVKFNGGGGIAFDTGNDNAVTGNTVTHTRIWMNVLDNWPRFNNHNSGGGWPGGLSWYSQSNGLAQGNVIYQNGGEGLILWGTNAGHVAVNQVARNNVIFDNWSVNLYLDNTQGSLVEQNFVFQHPRDPSQTFDNLFTISNGFNTDFGKRLTPVNVSLADEPGSAADGNAHLSDVTLINNMFVGGKFGFIDYDDGTKGVVHGLKNCLIANNTWVLGDAPIPGQEGFGWRHLFSGSNPDASTNSIFQNNVISLYAGDHFVEVQPGAGAGIAVDHNIYSGAGKWWVAAEDVDFAMWKSGHPWDQASLTADAMLESVAEFSQTAAQKPIYDWTKAVPRAGSPVFRAGVKQPRFTTDFTGATRKDGAYDLGAASNP